MESIVNLENLKELLYFYSISERNGISILNKNLEKEKYVNNISFFLFYIFE